MDSMRSTLPVESMNSPRMPNAFVGRHAEIAELAVSLSRHRLVTISGTGGVGKTRLAMETMQQVAGDYPDGVFMVRLAATRDDAGAIQEIAQALHASAAAEQLQNEIHSILKRGRHLLVLDNLEHLDLKGTIEALLAACPGLTILATSRRPLHIDGEYLLRLAPFQTEVLASSDIAVLRLEPAVDLFCRRASEAPRPVLMLDQHLPEIAEICRRVDGLPLAIELVVGWMRLLNPVELLAYLDRVLPRLRGAAIDDDERHQTMSSTIQWSYDLLSDDEQRLFRRLSGFVGGFTIDMARRMAAGHSGLARYPFCDGFNWEFIHPAYEHGDPTISGEYQFYPELALPPITLDVIDGLQSLEEVGLIQRIESGGTGSRYDLLELIREFGQDQLAINDEIERVAHLHAAIMLAIVEIWHEGVFIPSQRRWNHAEINLELPNLRQALGWSIERGVASVEMSQRLTGSTWMFWHSRGLVTEGRRWIEASYAMGRATWAQDMKMSALGFLCWIQGDDDRAEEVLIEAVERAGKAGFILTQASCYLYLALVAWRRNPGDLTAMQAHLSRSLELYSSVNDAVGLGICTLMTGIVDRLHGEPARALERFEKSQIYFSAQEFEWGVTSAIYYAGDATLELATKEPGKFPDALRLLGDALLGYSDHGDWWGMGGVIGGIATAATHLGDQELAARLFGLSTALVGIVGAFLPPANLEFYRAVAGHLSAQMGEEQFQKAYLAGVAIESMDALTVGQQALASLRLRLTQLAQPKIEPLPKLLDGQKRMVQLLVDGNPPKRIAELIDRELSSVYQMLKRICRRWDITTWEEIAPLAIARGYATPNPREDPPTRKGWSQ